MRVRLGKWTLTVRLSDRKVEFVDLPPDHPDVVCPACETKYVACDVGNHYCPGCGENAEEAMALLWSSGPRVDGLLRRLADALEEVRSEWVSEDPVVYSGSALDLRAKDLTAEAEDFLS